MRDKACGQFTIYSPQMMRRIDPISNGRAEAPMPRLAGLLLPLWVQEVRRDEMRHPDSA